MRLEGLRGQFRVTAVRVPFGTDFPRPMSTYRMRRSCHCSQRTKGGTIKGLTALWDTSEAVVSNQRPHMGCDNLRCHCTTRLVAPEGLPTRIMTKIS